MRPGGVSAQGLAFCHHCVLSHVEDVVRVGLVLVESGLFSLGSVLYLCGGSGVILRGLLQESKFSEVWVGGLPADERQGCTFCHYLARIVSFSL